MPTPPSSAGPAPDRPPGRSPGAPSGRFPGPAVLLAGLAALLLLAGGIRLLGVSTNPVELDEFYHLLAGQSWWAHGDFRILDGVYLRGRAFTVLAGLSFGLFGWADLVVARMPSVLLGTLLVVAVAAWTGRAAGWGAACVAGLLIAFDDLSVSISQFARFYAGQALLVWLGATLAFAAATRPWHPAGAWRPALAAAAFALAFHLQPSTLIALLALGLWLAADALLAGWAAPLLGRLGRRRWIAGLLALLAAGAALYLLRGELARFRETSYWATERRDQIGFYHRHFRDTMPLLWGLAPVAALLAFRRWPRPALFCAVMAAVPLLLHSFAGMKSARYPYYAMPFFLALWGMAGSLLLAGLYRRAAGTLAGRAFPRPRGGALALTGLALLAAILANRDGLHAVRSAGSVALRMARDPAALLAAPPDPSWPAPPAALRAAIAEPGLLMVADDLRTLAYLGGGFDVLVSRSRLDDVRPPVEFARDFRTGRPVVASAAAVADLIACHPRGTILVPGYRWRSRIGIQDPAADAIERLTDPGQAVPGFRVFRWRHAPQEAACTAVREAEARVAAMGSQG